MPDKALGKYLTFTPTTIMVRVPNTKQINFNVKAVAAAVDCRDALCKEKGISPFHTSIRRHTRNHADKKNDDLPVGIHRGVNRKLLADGSEAEYPYVAAHSHTGKYRCRSTYQRPEEDAVEELLRWRAKELAIRLADREKEKDR